MKMLSHKQVTEAILGQIQLVDFKTMALLEPKERLQRKHYVVVCIEVLLKLATKNGWGLCVSGGLSYIYNGAYWKIIEKEELQRFLGEAAHRMGLNGIDAAHHSYRDELYLQFLSSAYVNQKQDLDGLTLINLQNGTFELSTSTQNLRQPNSLDFLKYQLPFCFDEMARASTFETYLNRVLPDTEAQQVLAEYLGYIFIKNSSLKLEKALMLLGSGANGKSVFFEIVGSLLGPENISNFSLQKITTQDYSRAMLNGKLLNYASEISGNLDTAVFKQLVSGEPVEARLPFGKPFTLSDYAKLLFNCNELPKDVEHTDAYFRRLIIIPFKVTIPACEQNTSLAKKIINEELPGVFNWVLSGLKRLIKQGHFTPSALITDLISQYRAESNSVQLFLDDRNLYPSSNQKKNIGELYESYRFFCEEDGCKALTKIHFKKRLENMGVTISKTTYGYTVYLAQGEQSLSQPPNRPITITAKTADHIEDGKLLTEYLDGIINKGENLPKPLF
jgi:putative DNA primase/helicase